MAHSVADLVSFLHSMMDGDDSNSEYTESAYIATSNSKSFEEECKPRGHNRKKDKQAKACGKKEKKTKKDDNEAPAKNTCPHCKKIQCRKPHRINPDKCMWNKKYKGYRFKSICNEPKVTFKQHHSFTADMGGYAKTKDSESE